MPLAQLLCSHSLLLKLPVAKIFQEHVGRLEQTVHGLAVFLACKVEHDTALASIEQREE